MKTINAMQATTVQPTEATNSEKLIRSLLYDLSPRNASIVLMLLEEIGGGLGEVKFDQSLFETALSILENCPCDQSAFQEFLTDDTDEQLVN
jgi:hypothetical protein